MRLFNRNIEPSCVYCRRGSEIGQGEIACVKRGIVATSGYCGSFKYEPTKRVPHSERRLNTAEFSQEDFAL